MSKVKLFFFFRVWNFLVRVDHEKLQITKGIAAAQLCNCVCSTNVMRALCLRFTGNKQRFCTFVPGR